MSLCSSLVGSIKKINRNLFNKIETCHVLLHKNYSTRELLKEAYCRTKLKCRCKCLLLFFFTKIETKDHVKSKNNLFTNVLFILVLTSNGKGLENNFTYLP